MGNRDLKEKRHIDYSKIMCSLILSVIVGVVVFSCYMIWETENTDALTELIIGAFAALTLVAGFYLWRAKAKDKIQMYRDDPAAFKAAGIGEDNEEDIGG